MSRFALILAFLALPPSPPALADERPLRILCSTSDLADIARTVGGDRVEVSCLCKGPEDPHFLDARPSFLRLLNRADMVVVTGLELEIGYMPLLLRDAANPAVRPGGPGHLDASTRVKKLQVVEGGAPSRAHGDVHAFGNPHYLMDPANAALVAEDLAAALSALRPGDAKGFETRAAAFRGEIKGLLEELARKFEPHRGARIVTYHDNLPYLAARLGLEVVGTIESKPGVPPTARHLKELKDRAKDARAVIFTTFQPRAPVDAFCRETGARAVLVAHQPGAFEGVPDLLTMYRRNADAILHALGEAK